MKCPYCGNIDGKVLDTRTNTDGSIVKRRRECLSCNKRFTTHETIENMPIFIVKKDNSMQAFDKTKIMNGLLRACEKRPVTLSDIEEMTDTIEQKLKNLKEKEIKSSYIGILIMEILKETDLIAYVRFVSVYKDFNSVDTFIKELETLISKEG